MFQKGNHSKTEFKKGMKMTKEIREKIREKVLGQKRPKQSLAVRGEKNGNWKGEKVKYTGLHMWIYRRLGRPQKCEFCGKDGLTGRQIHWANIGHLYKRNLTDWIRLCFKCHKKYDNEVKVNTI